MISSPTAWGNAVGTGTTGPFAIPFHLYSQTHLTVLMIVSGVLTTLALGTDYNFTPGTWTPDNKGQVAQPEITTTVAIAGGATLIFLLVLPGTQLTAFTSGPYSPGADEAADDLLTQLGNMLMERVAKSIRAPDQEFSGNGVNMVVPPIANRVSSVLGFDVNGAVKIYPLVSSTVVVGPPCALIEGVAFASLPVQAAFALAWTTDQVFAMFNTNTNSWEKIARVAP